MAGACRPRALGIIARSYVPWCSAGIVSKPLSGIEAYPRVRLGHAPTPLEAASNLGSALGIDLWIKRDDCTGLVLGGNKVRQLEFYLGEAEQRRADTVLITGAVQSNFACLAAAGARKLGMDIHVQLEERVDGADDLYRSSGNVLLERLLGATLHSFPVGEDEEAADAALEDLAGSLARAGRRPYVIHLGVAHPPLGGLGYVVAAGEIAEQARERGIEFDALVCASGSALTHAGTLVGMRALDLALPVLGVCVRREASRQRPRVLRRAAEIAAMIGRSEVLGAGDVDVSDEVLAPGYGRFNPAVGEALSMAARHEALFLDPVYTGRVMAGLVAHVRSGRIAPGSRVLFLHTGGVPALFAYAAKLEPWLSDAPRSLTGRDRPGRH